MRKSCDYAAERGVLLALENRCFRHPVLLRRYRKTRVVHTDGHGGVEECERDIAQRE